MLFSESRRNHDYQATEYENNDRDWGGVGWDLNVSGAFFNPGHCNTKRNSLMTQEPFF